MSHTIVKRSSLEGLAEGWDESCYAYVKPATYEDRKKFLALLDDPDADSMGYQRDLVKRSFVSGKVKQLNTETGEFELVDLTAEDLEINLVNDRLALDIMGFDLDPKELAAQLSENVPPSATSNTETPSSTDSPKS